MAKSYIPFRGVRKQDLDLRAKSTSKVAKLAPKNGSCRTSHCTRLYFL